MKKTISIILLVALLCNVGIYSAFAEDIYNSPFDVLMPAIPVVDSHFKSYYDAGRMDEKTELIIGDANIDGKVNAADALFALIYGLDMPFEEHAIRGSGVSYNNLYYRGFRQQPPGNQGCALKILFELRYQEYADGTYMHEPFEGNQHYYRFNSILMSDVDNDGFANAVDAMYILQYAVGKIDSFERTDFSSKGNMFYVPWYDEWEPGMIWNEDIEEKTSSGYYSPFQ